MSIPTFRLDVSDPVHCGLDVPQLLFSFEDQWFFKGKADYHCANFALAAGLNPWIGKWVISEAGLRVLARAALATADHVAATQVRQNA